jgi:Cu/Ag efflux protein CusF
MQASFAVLALALAATAPLLSTGCSKESSAGTPAGKTQQAATKTYDAKGTIKSFGPDKKFVNISHEAIPGYMAAMTMSFEPKAPTQLDGLAAGDKIAFTFSDDEGRRVIQTIAKAP